MKKNTIKAFTLVEMLIVIVIIGILIASLMPRMQTAQGRARDVARKNDLSQIQTAIITSQADRGARPGMKGNHWKKTDDTPTTTDSGTTANSGIPVEFIWKNLSDAWMTDVPKDPNGSNIAFGFWSTEWSSTDSNPADAWQYYYIVAKRNWVNNAWFALMAKTEVEWSSNWVVCQDTSNGKALSSRSTAGWYIQSSDDLATIKLCQKVSKWSTCASNQAECTYTEVWELRYILLY